MKMSKCPSFGQNLTHICQAQGNFDVSVVPADGPISEEITKNHDPSDGMTAVAVAAVEDDVKM